MCKKMMVTKQKQASIKTGNPSEQRLMGEGASTPLLYDRQEAAEALVTTLDRMRRERTGPKCIPIGRRILYPRESLEFWVLEQPEG